MPTCSVPPPIHTQDAWMPPDPRNWSLCQSRSPRVRGPPLQVLQMIGWSWGPPKAHHEALHTQTFYLSCSRTRRGPQLQRGTPRRGQRGGRVTPNRTCSTPREAPKDQIGKRAPRIGSRPRRARPRVDDDDDAASSQRCKQGVRGSSPARTPQAPAGALGFEAGRGLRRGRRGRCEAIRSDRGRQKPAGPPRDTAEEACGAEAGAEAPAGGSASHNEGRRGREAPPSSTHPGAEAADAAAAEATTRPGSAEEVRASSAARGGRARLGPAERGAWLEIGSGAWSCAVWAWLWAGLRGGRDRGASGEAQPASGPTPASLATPIPASARCHRWETVSGGAEPVRPPPSGKRGMLRARPISEAGSGAEGVARGGAESEAPLTQSGRNDQCFWPRPCL